MTIEDRPDNAPSLQLVLEGGLARLGEVPALDVARLIEGSIRAIARAAEMILSLIHISEPTRPY